MELPGEVRDRKEIFYELAVRDVAAASDLLLQIWKATSARDGYVSWEVHLNLADDRRELRRGTAPAHETDKRLDGLGGHGELSSRASSESPTPSSPISTTSRPSRANAGERLASAGTTKQRCVWASTSRKNPPIRTRCMSRG
jgi:hypothetical protein